MTHSKQPSVHPWRLFLKLLTNEDRHSWEPLRDCLGHSYSFLGRCFEKSTPSPHLLTAHVISVGHSVFLAGKTQLWVLGEDLRAEPECSWMNFCCLYFCPSVILRVLWVRKWGQVARRRVWRKHGDHYAAHLPNTMFSSCLIPWHYQEIFIASKNQRPIPTRGPPHTAHFWFSVCSFGSRHRASSVQ